MWNPTNDQTQAILKLFNGAVEDENELERVTDLVATLYDVACSYCNYLFDMDSTEKRAEQSAMRLYISKAIQYLSRETGVTAMKLGDISFSYGQEMPKEVYAPLKPFRKLKWS